MLNKENFLEMCQRGEASLNDINNFIKWYESNKPDITLHEFLGMSVEEYCWWEKNPNILPTIIYMHTKGYDFVNDILPLENLNDLETDEALERISSISDFSSDIEQPTGLNQVINLLNELQQRSTLTETQLALSHYFLANAYSDLKNFTHEETGWNWEQETYEKEILHLRLALRGADSLDETRRCQILTNLGNAFSFIGRFVEAIEYWNRALAIFPERPVAIGNRGIALLHYGMHLYDPSHQNIFFHHAYTDLNDALSQSSELANHAIQEFDTARKWLEDCYKVTEWEEINNLKKDLCKYHLGESVAEFNYRYWCLKNGLFLNPINDLDNYPIAAYDVLTTPNMTFRVKNGEIKRSIDYVAYFCQMKQEYISIRYLYYEAITDKQLHFSDKEVILYDIHDDLIYSLALEKMKIVFRGAYSLFDKIAYFLNFYLALSHQEHQISFKSIWYQSGERNKGLKKIFAQYENWPLRGLFWLSKDLTENREGFKEVIEPDAQLFQEIRNQLEHKYLRIYGDTKEALPSNDKNSFSLFREDFEIKTLKLLKTVRSALIYLVLAIHREETRRRENKSVEGILKKQLDVLAR